uniref:Uncharacterized protein n=1 Tax=Aquila chrysaetos chrysaetos TaxID=223781 RepID=A0A663F419_AQUCH
ITAKEDPTVGTNNHEIHELNPVLQACFLHVASDFHKFAKYMEAEFQDVGYLEKLQKSYNPTMRNEHNSLKSLSYTSHSSWSLTEMAAAGFYHMLVKCSVQWFCCGLVLFTMKGRCTLYEQHKKFCPTCEFVLDKEVGNISKYNIRVQKLKKNPAEMPAGTTQRTQGCSPLMDGCFMPEEQSPIHLRELRYSSQVIGSDAWRDFRFDL